MLDGEKHITGLLRENESENDRESEGILITPRIIKTFLREHGLNKELRHKHLFAFGMGTVLTAFFAQWTPGLGQAGPFGLLIAITLAFFIYFTFFTVLARFAVNFPFAGGPYAYARQGLGTFGGYLAGVGTIVQFVCASALILMIVRRYFLTVYPHLSGDAVYIALGFFLLLLIVHVSGIWLSGIVQIFLTGTALSGLVLFFIGSGDAVQISNLQAGPVLPNGWDGVFTALPFVMWFYLGLEGITMSAEETRKPQRDLPFSLITGLGAAFLVSAGTWYFVAGSEYWPLLKDNDFPLLFILEKVQSQDKILLSTFSLINLSVFFTSLHGLINGYSRQVYALSRAGYFPIIFSRVRTKRQTPFMAIVIPGLAVAALSFTGSWQTVTGLALFSAILVYILVTVSYLRIRKSKPEMLYKNRIIGHPAVLSLNIGLLVIVLTALVYNDFSVVWTIVPVYFSAVLYFGFFASKYIRNEAPEESAALSTQNKVRVEFK